MSYVVNLDQHVVIGGVPLSTPAWEVLNIQALMSGPATRGENLIMPGSTGVRALRHRNTQRTVTLELAVFGRTDPYGVDHPDPYAGVWTNWLALRDQFNALLLNVGDSTTTVSAIYAGVTLTGPAQILTYELGAAYGPCDLSATLDLNLITGMLT